MNINQIVSDGYLGGDTDCYVITKNRTKDYLYRFLDRFLPERLVFQDEFVIPPFADESRIAFSSVDELIDYLEKNPGEASSIYWKSLKENDLPFASCTFTDDDFLILGLSCKRTSKPGDVLLVDWSIAEKYFRELQEFANNTPGYITLEEPPPENSIEFLKNCEKYCQSEEPT